MNLFMAFLDIFRSPTVRRHHGRASLSSEEWMRKKVKVWTLGSYGYQRGPSGPHINVNPMLRMQLR